MLLSLKMETVTLPKEDFESMQREIATLRKTSLYARLLEFEKNISLKKYTRKDLGF
jgi:hypothetical protein